MNGQIDADQIDSTHHRPVFNSKDHLSQFFQPDPLPRILHKDPLEDLVSFLTDRKNLSQDFAIMKEGPVGVIRLGARLFPRVSATGQVDENNSKRPHVVFPGGVTR